MTRITRDHLDFSQFLIRERDRCRAAGVAEYVFTIGEYDLNYTAKILRRIAEVLGEHTLGRIRRVDARPADLAALRRLLPEMPVDTGSSDDTDVVVDFAVPSDQAIAPEVRMIADGPIGTIRLSRPQALNALTLPMIRAMDAQLRVWADDPTIKAVVVSGEGGKAFCAGGDVLAIYNAGLTDRQPHNPGHLTVSFFREEYTLNHLIHRFPKPYVALVDGVSMGGGVGVSIHGSRRVVTETTLFAMPETGIGLFPDIGGGWFLPRFPGQTGAYLGLTGARCKAADCLYVGYATHFVPRDRIGEISGALAEADWPHASDLAGLHAVIDGVLDRLGTDPGAPPLAADRDAIDRCFAHDRVEAIVTALEQQGTEWARGTLAKLDGHSPLSLKVALRQIRLGAALDYEDVVAMEYRLSQRAMAAHDFYEGIRALLVDKDKSPLWRPASLRDVSPEMVEAYFAPLDDRDLLLSSHLGRAA